MNLTDLPKYDPNLSDNEEYPEIPDGTYPLKLNKIKPIPLDLSGKAGEGYIFTIEGGEYHACTVYMPVYTKHSIKWKVKSSQNLLANFVDCANKVIASTTEDLINEIVDGVLCTKADKNGKKWCNVVKFSRSTNRSMPSQQIVSEDVPW